MRFRYSWRKIANLFVNSEYPDEMPHFAASDLGLYCLPITLLGVSRLQWVTLKPWPQSMCVMFLCFQLLQVAIKALLKIVAVDISLFF